MPVSSDGCTVPGSTSQVRSMAWLLERVEPAGLVRGVRGAGQQAGGDEHEHGAGEAEELLQVDAHAAAVDAVADHDRERDAEQRRRCPPWPGWSTRWNAASRKTAVSRPSRRTAKKAMPTSASVEPRASARRGARLELPAQRRARCARIQTIMNVTIPTAARPTMVSSPSCWRWGRSSSTHLQAPRRRRRRARSRCRRRPHVAQGVATALLARKRGDDPDDQGGFEALAQADDESRQHMARV